MRSIMEGFNLSHHNQTNFCGIYMTDGVTLYIVLNILLVVATIYFFVGFRVVLYQKKSRSSARSRKIQRLKSEQRNLKLLEHSITCLAIGIVAICFFEIITIATWSADGHGTYGLIAFGIVIGTFPKAFTYLFLWTRQWIFYSSPLLKYSIWFKSVNVFLLIFSLTNTVLTTGNYSHTNRIGVFLIYYNVFIRKPVL